MLVSEGPQVVDYVEAQLHNRGGPMGLFTVAWEWLHTRVPLLPSEEEIVQRLSSSLGGVASEAASRAGSHREGSRLVRLRPRDHARNPVLPA